MSEPAAPPARTPRVTRRMASAARRLASSDALAGVADLVTLEAFAFTCGVSPRTIANDLTSCDIARRLAWPEFRKGGQGWLTTTAFVRRWFDARPSTYPTGAVGERLAAAIRRVG